jgi:hypothetical protein
MAYPGIFDLLILVCVGGLKVKYGVRYPKFIWAPCAQLYSVRSCVVGPIADEHKVSFSRQCHAATIQNVVFARHFMVLLPSEAHKKIYSHAVQKIKCT